MFKIFNINLKPESALLASSLLTVHFVVSAQSNTTTIPATVAISGQDTAVNGLVLNGVSIVDTFTGRVTSHMTIVMVGGTITEIAPEGSLPVRGDLQNVDARGKYVVPSFNDMHVHVLEQPFPSDVYKLLLANGVTGWRQMSGSPQLLQARQAGALGLGMHPCGTCCGRKVRASG